MDSAQDQLRQELADNEVSCEYPECSGIATAQVQVKQFFALLCDGDTALITTGPAATRREASTKLIGHLTDVFMRSQVPVWVGRDEREARMVAEVSDAPEDGADISH